MYLSNAQQEARHRRRAALAKTWACSECGARESKFKTASPGGAGNAPCDLCGCGLGCHSGGPCRGEYRWDGKSGCPKRCKGYVAKPLPRFKLQEVCSPEHQRARKTRYQRARRIAKATGEDLEVIAERLRTQALAELARAEVVPPPRARKAPLTACQACKGTGRAKPWAGKIDKCGLCRGTGKVEAPAREDGQQLALPGAEVARPKARKKRAAA